MFTYFGAGKVSSPKPVWTFRLPVAVCVGVKGRNSLFLCNYSCVSQTEKVCSAPRCFPGTLVAEVIVA